MARRQGAGASPRSTARLTHRSIQWIFFTSKVRPAIERPSWHSQRARTYRFNKGSEEDEVCKEFPPSAMPVTDGAKVNVKNRPVAGEVTAIFLKKQIKTQGEEDPQPHMRHWWLMFQVEDEKWMQVDLIQAHYRIIWDARFEEAEGIRYEKKEVPPGLTSQKVAEETSEIAKVEQIYYNPVEPRPQYRRYSCHDFAILLAGRLNIEL